MQTTYAADAPSVAQETRAVDETTGGNTQAPSNNLASYAALAISRYAYLCGITHKLDADERAKVQSTFELDDKLRQGKLAQEFLDDDEFTELADEIADYVDINDPNAFFINAYGIVHGIVDDELKTRLLTKHGFIREGDKPFRGRHDELDALFAETQRILYPSLFEAADRKSESAWINSDLNPLNASKCRADRFKVRISGNIKSWIPNEDASVSDCLDECSGLLTEAKRILLEDDEISDLTNAALRLVELAHVMVSETHEKLIVHASETIKPLIQNAKVAA